MVYLPLPLGETFTSIQKCQNYIHTYICVYIYQGAIFKIMNSSFCVFVANAQKLSILFTAVWRAWICPNSSLQ